MLALPLAVALPSGRVAGTPVLARSVPQVVRALGPPTSVERLPNRRDLMYEGRLEVIFSGPDADPSAQKAWAILLLDPRARATGIGRPLSVPPKTLEQRLRTTSLREERRYRCDRRGCFGTFFGAAGTRRVIYGLLRGGRRYLGVQVWPNPTGSGKPSPAASSVAPVASGYERSLRPCSARTQHAPSARGSFR